ncbi:hypothetical protein V9T40_001460 [Parthenolecanium corni]|uniref:Uncharacterized protein n=1 Tax=Parthenolecanium corni TaxID=536013 RepID=A0AAN9TKS4_9HEMI
MEKAQSGESLRVLLKWIGIPLGFIPRPLLVVGETTTWRAAAAAAVYAHPEPLPEDLDVPEEQKFCAAILRRPFRCCF